MLNFHCKLRAKQKDNALGFPLYKLSVAVCKIEQKNNLIEKIKLFPNPTEGTLHISSSIAIDKIECFNNFGQLVFHKPFENEIDLSNYAAGNYLIKLNYSNGKEYKVYKIEIAK